VSIFCLDSNRFSSLQNAQTAEEINDCLEHFQLYYSNCLSRMVQYEIEKNDDPDQRPAAIPKTTIRNDKYWNCVLGGPGKLTELFGLTSEQIAENFEYIRHHCVSNEQFPEEVAEACKTAMFSEVDMVINGAVYVMAYRLSREPGVRRRIREVFRNFAKIKVYPTKRGLVTIDDAHPLYYKRYIDGKPIRQLEKTEYLQYQVVRFYTLFFYNTFLGKRSKFTKC
jgi:transcription elongation factor SPT6